jgi:KaiC/GvpD/RAD55 family RecA-like ATPase
MKKYSTGITPLDAQLGGGFPSGSLILLLEEPGAGADVFSFHFAVAGINNNEKVLYITTNDTKDQILQNIKLYFALENGVADKIEFIDLVSPRLIQHTDSKSDVKSFLRQMKHDPLKHVKTIIANSDHERVILNSLAYFVLNYNTEDVVELINEMSLTAKKNDSVVLLLMTKGIADDRLENTIKFMADGIIEMTINESGNEIQRLLKILKLKRVLVPKSILRYDLTERGIRMESVMRVL